MSNNSDINMLKFIQVKQCYDCPFITPVNVETDYGICGISKEKVKMKNNIDKMCILRTNNIMVTLDDNI